MAAPLITAITTVPNRENATNQASFSNDVDTFFSQVDGFQTQANVQAQYLDGVAAEVDADAATAQSAKNSAVAAANYKGDWATSSDVKQGESYSYSDQVWVAKQDSVNVTPIDGAFWIEGFGDAVNVRYDNTTSGLAATDVQGAIDEVEGRVNEIENPNEILSKLLTVDGSGSGLDADLLRGLPADFTSSLIDNGYQVLPSGLTIQWGSMTCNYGDNTVVLPISYTTANLQAFACNGSSSIVGSDFGTKPLNLSAINVSSENPNSRAGRWFSIGF